MAYKKIYRLGNYSFVKKKKKFMKERCDKQQLRYTPFEEQVLDDQPSLLGRLRQGLPTFTARKDYGTNGPR